MKNQLLVLFFCNLCMSAIGNGLVPLVPLYALALGASPGPAGWPLASANIALALGTLTASWLANRARSDKWAIVAAGLLSGPLFILLGHDISVWQLTLLLTIAWFCGGIAGVLMNVLTALYADPTQRGRTFGLMHLALPLGGFIGAILIGWLAEGLGYPTMFLVVGILAISWPLLALLGLADMRPAHRRSVAAQAGASDAHSLNSAVYPLLVSGLLSSTAIIAGQLGTSLLMQMLGFSTSAISSTAAVGGLVSIPLLPLFGIVSDRLGRRSCLMISYILAAGGVLLLAGADQLWHFWAAAALLSIAKAAGVSVASAFVTDLLPREALGRGLALVNTISWVAAFVGFATSGYLLEQLGASALFCIAAGLACSAALVLGLLPSMRRVGQLAAAQLEQSSLSG